MEVDKLQISVPTQDKYMGMAVQKPAVSKEPEISRSQGRTGKKDIVSNTAKSSTEKRVFNTAEESKQETGITKEPAVSDVLDAEKEPEQKPKIKNGYDIKDRDISYSYNKDINRVIITVSDRNSDKVLKEIPPEKMQNIIKNIRQMAGMEIDTQI